MVSWNSDFKGISPEICQELLFSEAKSVKEWLSLPNKLCVSAGRGVGKSLLLILKRHESQKRYQDGFNPDKERYKGVAFLPQDDFVDHNMDLRHIDWGKAWQGEFLSDFHRARSLWMVALSVSIITSVDERCHIPRLLELLDNGVHDSQVYDFFKTYFEKIAVSARRPNTVVRDLLGENITRNILGRICNNAGYFSDVVRDDIRHAVVMFVDTTDEIDCTRDKKDVWINIQNGLLAAAWNISTSNRHIKIYTAIRQEAWDNYEGYEAENVRNSVCELNYQFELEKMIKHLFNKYEGKALESIIGFDSLKSPHSCIVENPMQYIVRHTQQKPRDMVEICGQICSDFQKDEVIHQNKAQKVDIFRRIVNNYAQNKMIEHLFKDYQYFREYIESAADMKKLLSHVKCNVLEWTELPQILEAYCADTDHDPEKIHPFCDLFRMGLLGTLLRRAPDQEGGEQYFLNTFSKDSGRWTEDKILPQCEFYLTHPCLSAMIIGLNGDEYYPLVGVRTGENLFLSTFDIQLIKAQKSICNFRLDSNPRTKQAAITILNMLRTLYQAPRPLDSSHIEQSDMMIDALSILEGQEKIEGDVVALCKKVIGDLMNKLKHPSEACNLT